MWVKLPTVPTGGGGGGWSLENVIDIEMNLRSVCPGMPIHVDPNVVVEFKGSGKRSGDVVLLQVHSRDCVVLDLKTKEIHKKK